MSTKSTIRYSDDEFHLYYDMMDPLDRASVYLRIDSCEFTASAGECGGTVTLRLPEPLARKLGLFDEAERLREEVEYLRDSLHNARVLLGFEKPKEVTTV